MDWCSLVVRVDSAFRRAAIMQVLCLQAAEGIRAGISLFLLICKEILADRWIVQICVRNMKQPDSN